MGLRPGDDAEMPGGAGPFGEGRRRRVLRPHLDRRRDTTVALLPIGYADGVFRTLSGRIDVLINGRLRPSVGRICMDQFVVDLGPGPVDVAEGDDAILFGPGTRRRTHRAGLGRAAGHHQLRGGHQPAWPGHPDVPRTHRRAEAVERSADSTHAAAGAVPLAGRCGRGDCRRHAPRACRWRDRCAGGSPPTTRTRTRISSCSTPTAVSSSPPPTGFRWRCARSGPEDAPLTVVFAHGFCLRMGAFHFQRARLTEQWGTQVRMVFYDQRGHGQSGEAPPDTYTVDQLGQDLETVLAVMAPRGPVVLVGHSMGGMTVLSHARQYPQRYPTRIVGAALIASAAEGVSRSPLGEILKNPALEAVRFAARYAPKTVHRRPRRRQVGDRPDPAGGVLRRREDQPERRGVLRAR